MRHTIEHTLELIGQKPYHPQPAEAIILEEALTSGHWALETIHYHAIDLILNKTITNPRATLFEDIRLEPSG